MTDEQIIKALECCVGGGKCKEIGCPFRDSCMEDLDALQKQSLDLINRKRAEIERLKDENKSIRYCYEQAKSYNDTLAESCEKNCKKFNMATRTEAIKEFWERLKKEIRYCTDVYGNSIQAINVECANRIVKEMESDKNV